MPEMRFLKLMIQAGGYLVYTLVVLVFMLWYQFPAAAVKAKVEAELHKHTPDLEWEIGNISPSLPIAVRLNDVKISSSGSGSGKKKKTVVKIDSLSLRPDLLAYRRNGKLSVGYSLKIFGGKVSGRLHLADDYTMQYNGKVDGVKAGVLNTLHDFDRVVLGTLSGNFTGKGKLDGMPVIELQGDVKLQKGTISLQEPVLGMEQLVFNEVNCQIKYDSGMIDISNGKLESRLLAADYAGTISPNNQVMLSRLQLTGTLIPRPEFLAGIKDAMAVTVLKKQLRGGKLPFTINGTLQKPGIVFSGLPAGMNKRMQGEGRQR